MSSMNPFAALADMANHSTIYKRHANRNMQHNGDQAGIPVQHPDKLLGADHSIGETVRKLTRRSTIFRHHEQHHADMKHDQHAGETHMSARMLHEHDGIIDTFKYFMSESSIFDRNSRRNHFLHD